ncbi:hypothetical protein LD125_00039 [Mesoplasma sp. JKS002658]|uniref:hypothetical protein n=1 Tax=Mesoplasma whartonense TaxID=2878854 RepID=UPI002022A212|nr:MULTISPECIES: hypothetical protein [unclassified Mesoplasma]MCL8211711.1 hypothetical protein [Mesoplasma sp. JKS002664]MCL8212088.1 hypothetical protein [Mesoplasma sp. JKS002662]MCL8212711.1 hypothetical protein [Mesoplasma sp. JKS002661]MCL8213807.1 hypothetical protein [Mesoplasma sp. JKS002658]MCL8215047.1 hypothetical protein [Mesoplasma sp. JKS002663]
MYQNREKYLSAYQSLLGIAYAFAILSTVLTAALLLPMLWTIPMTKSINKKRLAAEPSECLTLGVCALFFLSIISGVLLIVANGKVDQYERAKISDATNTRMDEAANNFQV